MQWLREELEMPNIVATGMSMNFLGNSDVEADAVENDRIDDDGNMKLTQIEAWMNRYDMTMHPTVNFGLDDNHTPRDVDFEPVSAVRAGIPVSAEGRYQIIIRRDDEVYTYPKSGPKIMTFEYDLSMKSNEMNRRLYKGAPTHRLTMQSHEEYLELLLEQCNQEYEIATKARLQGHDPRIEVEIPQAHDLAQRTQQLLDFLHPRNTAEQIRSLTKHHEGNREMVALDLAFIVCAETLLYGKSRNCKTCNGTGEVKEGEWRKRECNACSGKGVIIEYKEGIKTITSEEVLEEFEAADKTKWRPRQIAMAIYHGICAGLAVLTEGILVAPLEGVVSARILTNEDDTKCLAVNFAGRFVPQAEQGKRYQC